MKILSVALGIVISLSGLLAVAAEVQADSLLIQNGLSDGAFPIEHQQETIRGSLENAAENMHVRVVESNVRFVVRAGEPQDRVRLGEKVSLPDLEAVGFVTLESNGITKICYAKLPVMKSPVKKYRAQFGLMTIDCK